MTSKSSIQLIDKEQIKFLTFPKEDVLVKANDKLNRSLELKRAMVLGNLEQQKVKIVFVDNQGIKKVETTIWALTDKSVILKQSMVIPLGRVIGIS